MSIAQIYVFIKKCPFCQTNEYVEVMKTLDSLRGIYYNKALLGQIDVYEGIEQFREDAMKAGFGDVEPIIVEMFEKLGKF